MRSLPGSLDGSEGLVLKEDGSVLASFAIDDQRLVPGDAVYALFEDPDDRSVTSLRLQADRVTLLWNSGHRLDGVEIGRPDPVDANQFEIIHADL